MYDRAPRVVSQTCGSTDAHVGPGSYETTFIQEERRLRNDGYAPFLSMTSRDTFFNTGETVSAVPGPGQYDPMFPQESIPGGSTLDNKSIRFKRDSPTKKETPGPGTYNLTKRSDWIKEMNRNTSAPAAVENTSKGHMMTNRIKFHRKPEAPSIPSPGKAYGYEENEDGSLKKQNPPLQDDTIGPAFYQSTENSSNTLASVLYKGVHFGRLTSKRMDFTGKDGPGPGEYEPYIVPEGKMEHANIHEGDKARFEARIPRYHELVAKQEEKKGVPGPNKYSVPGSFDPVPPKVNSEGGEIEHPPFGTQAKRFDAVKSELPAPGSYNDPRVAFESLRKLRGLKQSPFGQTSIRFNPEHHTKKTPGPGAYNVVGMASDSMRKAYHESTRRGAFGTTAPRIQPMTRIQDNELPGPGHYRPKKETHRPRYHQPSSTFASLTHRLHDYHQPVAKELPPPCSYDVTRSFNRTQGKINPGKPRTDAAKKKQGAFSSSSSRFAPPRDVVISEADPAMPGPGTYNTHVHHDKKGNLMVSKDKRFKTVKSDAPGPTTYELSPLVQDTILKGTFNCTLNNPIVPRMQNANMRMSTNHPFLLGV